MNKRTFLQIFILSLISVVVFTAANAKADRWDGYNDPGMMDVSKNYEYNLNKLPLKANLDVMPWSETYWPTDKGSINYRWNNPVKDGFNYYPPTKDEVKAMTQDELAGLSPSEKYDLFMGHYDYPLYQEVRSYGNPRAPDWNGMCDGWSMSALQYAEPAPVTMPNPDGIMIPFGSSDIKGLMTFAAAIHFKAETQQVGSKCDGGIFSGASRACQDINAGALHVILANQIGIKKQGFVTERDPGKEIWNQPTFGYEFEIVGSASSSAASGVQVHGFLYYTDELDNSSWLPVVGTPNFKSDKVEMNYILDLDESGNIVGGSWIKGSDHPDFVWMATNKLVFTDVMSGINQLYKPVK